MLPYEIFISTIELLLNLLINLLKSNKDCFYNINDEPFNILNDIIVALISYSEEIKIEDLNQYILTDIINLFERYLQTIGVDLSGITIAHSKCPLR